MSALKVVATLLVAGLLFLLGFGVAKQQPARVEYRDRVVEVEKEKVQLTQKVDTAELIRQVTKVLESRKVATTRTIVREGGKETITERIKEIDKATTKVDHSVQTLTQVSTELKLLRESLRLTEHTQIVTTARPEWRLGLGVGYDLARFWDRGAGYNLMPVPGLVGQLQLERRLFGSLFGVVWAQTTGVAGVSLNLEW